MNISIEGKPAFAYLRVTLEPGETIVTESDAMSGMDVGVRMSTHLNGGFFGGLVRKYLGKESLFINRFTNNTSTPKRMTLVQATPGDVIEKKLDNNTYCLQPGAYIASTDGVKLGLQWAGFSSWFGGEGLFKLMVSGSGSVFLGAYGGLVEKYVEGEYIVDTAHLVAYEPQMKLSVQLSGGVFSSLFSGEGFVTRINGSGKIVIQSRSLNGLKGWLNKFI